MALPNGLDPAVVAKYGAAAARRRAFRQQTGVSDVRKASAKQLASLRPTPNVSGGIQFDLLPSHRQMLAKRAAARRGGRAKPTSTFGNKTGGGPAGGKPVA